MDVNRDVILDLLPVYLMGEASPATRTLVEEYLKRDPELAAQVRANAADVLQRVAVASPPPDVELRSVVRTRRVLTSMRWLFALGCTFTSFGLAFQFSTTNGRVVRAGLLLVDHPLLLGSCLAIGLACLATYFALRRGLYSARR